MHLNFDPSLDSEAVQAEVEHNGDLGMPYPHRRFARLWLNADHNEASARSVATKRRKLGLPREIDETYAAALKRDDIESPDAPSPVERLPEYGMQTHGEYTMYGHFFFLKRLLGNVQKWRFFIDQDPGLRAACLSAFHDEIRGRTADAFYVRRSDGGRKASQAQRREGIVRAGKGCASWHAAARGQAAVD